MDYVFHERQEGCLCAQHCLNALLQGSYYTAVDLAQIAAQLDQEENLCMAEAGHGTMDYQRFLQQPSSNYDDSGFFSIQVLQKALNDWNLELVLYSSSCAIAQEAMRDPCMQNAYVCNFKEHWFTIRKIRHQWWNLNSLLRQPVVISETYLAMFISQLQLEGYSIFIVCGELPTCEADLMLYDDDSNLRLATQQSLSSDSFVNTRQNNELASGSQGKLFSVQDLQNALQTSGSDEEQLKLALLLSMSEENAVKEKD